jgi:hypothetical protein
MRNLIWPVFILALTTACKDDADPTPDPSLVYFKVGEIHPHHNDSFILALQDPNDIEKAREMIQDPQKRKLVVAEITRDNSINYYNNKDLNQNRKWSWHVAEFLEFADNTIEILDGNPTYVEDNYDEWVNITKGENGNGRIGFWNYSILSEVDKEALD